MKFVLIRQASVARWRKAAGEEYREENTLQQLLYDNPDIFPVRDLGDEAPELKICLREASLPGSGQTDLIALDEQGGITLIECKLDVNRESRRAVIGQLLEYAAFLWRMPYEDFDAFFIRQEGKHLADLIQERTDSEDWSPEDFRESVRRSLETGAFRLVIAVDRLNDELRNIIEFLSREGQNQVPLYALEVSRYRDEETEILVPQVTGALKPLREAPAKAWTEDSFLESLGQVCDDDVRQKAERLVRFAKDTADDVHWGTGRAKGTFTYRVEHGGAFYSLFYVWTTGRITIPFPGSQWDRLSEELMQGWADRLRRVRGFEQLEHGAGKYPEFSLSGVLPTEDDLVTFCQAVEWLQAQIKQT
ncbi:MAG: hypothetical protein JSV65_08115 [Armatimonadota bacterium]|nr:MAG: hypothetical protein JSV65_08115 [Armatimonadota bacterium]